MDSALKRILVTGGNQGIGFALSAQLVHDHNCFVYLTARDVARGTTAAAEINKKAGQDRAHFVQLDV
jgi:NAD(P)-dependent dehydrogenase (short-subunit alcohol dehydrogenase family)